MEIALVGWESDVVACRFIRALEGLVLTMRHEASNKSALAVEVRMAKTPASMITELTKRADILVYSGHGGIDGTGAFIGTGQNSLYLSRLQTSLGLGIDTDGLVLDCCRGGDDRFKKELKCCLMKNSVTFSCTATAPYTHAPVLLPLLLAQLACPGSPPQLNNAKIRKIMNKAWDAASGIWGGDWERWIVT